MTAKFNLVLVHSTGWQAITDFEAIKRHVEELAPDIEVFIVSNEAPSSYTRKKAAARPSLVFSPIRLLAFAPVRGKLYAGRPMSKLVEMQKLAAGGMCVPRFEEIRPDTALSPEDYGAHTIVKASYAYAAWGQGIELQLTENVRYRPPDEYPKDHPGHRAPMVAQAYIDCGHAMSCRVLTIFGTPIFSYLRRATKPLALAGKTGPFEVPDFLPAPPDMTAHVVQEPDMLAFAAEAYEAMPEVALQACDILRDKEGRLHLLEINPGGGTWMFSSKNAQMYKDRLGTDDLSTYFDAFRVCARVLVERTRAEAV
jgi:hypothetical protein